MNGLRDGVSRQRGPEMHSWPQTTVCLPAGVPHRGWNRWRGYSLVEVMAAMVILALGMIGAFAALTTGAILLNVEGHKRTAVEIASSRQELLRTASFEDLPSLGEEEYAVEVDAISGNRRTTIEGVDEDEDGAVDYYRVIVQVNWTENGRDQEAELTTLRSRYR